MSAVEIRDVTPRDGLQGERAIEPARRAELVARLIACGIGHIEVGSFVSPRAVPAMGGAAQVVDAALAAASVADHDVTVWCLVPNAKGAELATAAGVDHLTITVSASEAYSAKNAHMSIHEAKAQVESIRADVPHAVLDEVISCCFGSPFDGEEITPDDVEGIVEHARRVGVDRVTLADTTGMATPRRVNSVLGVVGSDVGLHLHDTRGIALLNAWFAIEHGVRRFDTALGGLGGSPFAPRPVGIAHHPAAGGNLATEDLVLVLSDAGIETGIELDALLAAGPLLAEMVGHDLPSRVAAAGAIG